MPPNRSPLVVIVPGACGRVSGFDKIIPHLNGLETVPGVYPSCNPSNLNATCLGDTSELRRTLLYLLGYERDLVILAHSYGAAVASGAAKRLDKTSRLAEGHSTSVIGLIFIAGNLPNPGESLYQAVGLDWPPYIIPNNPSDGLMSVEPAMEILFNDCDPDPQLERSVFSHVLRALETGASPPAWKDRGFDGRRTYIRTVDDRCIPAALQDFFISRSSVEWDVVNFQSGHMPFVSQPAALAAHIVRFVDRVTSL